MGLLNKAAVKTEDSSPEVTGSLVSEDFSYYQQRVPGVFFHLGTGLDLPLHRGDYTIDEDVLLTGVGIYKTLLGLN